MRDRNRGRKRDGAVVHARQYRSHRGGDQHRTAGDITGGELTWLARQRSAWAGPRGRQ